MTQIHAIPGFQDLTRTDTEQLNVIERGRGVYVYDRSGKEFLDTSSSFFCMTLGYSDPELAQVLAAQAEKLSFHVSGEGKIPEITLRAAEEIARVAPFDDARVLFASTGSEANEFCQKLVRLAAWGRGEKHRTKVITRQGSYHGGSLATASMTQTFYGAGAEFLLPLPDFLTVSQPEYRNCAQPGEDENAFTDRLIAEVEALIQREGADTIAAFVAEPVSFAAGLVVPPRDYFPRLKELLRRHGIALVADEVVTGFGRLGKFFAGPDLGFEPDAIVVAKGMSAGHFPMSAVILTDELYQQVVQASQQVGVFGHGSTYSGHPLGAAVVLKVLERLQSPGFLEGVQSRARYLVEKLGHYAASDLIVDFRHRGMAAALQFAGDAERSVARAKAVAAACDEEGLIVRSVGHSLVFVPPLIISEAEIDDLIERFGAAWDRTIPSI